jgi:multidrug efflux pump subunit AcrA (membrane-fusion protein)
MNKIKKSIQISGILLSLARVLPFLAVMHLMVSCNKNKGGTSTVMTGSFIQSVTEAGELEAINASYITMPQISWQYGYQFKIIGLADHGKLVHKGDSVIKLDASSVYKYILDGEDKLENELAAANKQAVQSENNIQELNAQFKSEQAAYDLKKLEVERSKFDTEVKKRIKELEFQQATIRLNKVKRNLELKPLLDNYDRRIQRIKVIQRENDLKNAKETLKKFLIRSPLDGTFQVTINQFIQNPQNWRLGDSPYQGQMIASIPDITRMRAKTYINEADIKKVKLGMKVIVRLDALPSVPFNGTITHISKICLARDREKVFNVVVEIAESDLRLKPGMTVNCEYILYESDNDMFVPSNCLLKEKGQSYIFIKRGRSARKTEVKSGVANSNHTIIIGEVKPGQKLVPFDEVLNSKNL